MKKFKKVFLIILVFIALIVPFGYFMIFDRNNNGVVDDNNSTNNQIYTITWKNYDNTTLAIESYRFGDIPSYKGSEPKKTGDNFNYLYKFSGWVPELVGVSENKEYVASFEQIDNRIDSNSFFTNTTTNISFAQLVQENYINVNTKNSEIVSVNEKFNQLAPGSITIPSSIKIIGENAFNGCTSLQEVTISSNVEIIKERAFSNCVNLTKFNFERTIYPKATLKTFVFSGCSNLSDIVLPDNMIELQGRLFEDCTSLETFNVPKDVSKIYQGCFKGCTKLKNIVFKDNDNVTDIFFGSAFQSCNSLTSFVFSDKVSSIIAMTFNDCANLEYVIIPTSVSFVGKNFVTNCPNFDSVFYLGNSMERWNQIYEINSTEPVSYQVYLYSASRPTENVNSYWHYSNGVNSTPVIWE